MKEKINIGEIIKIGVILFIITALAAALLAFVNGKTAPLIEKNSLAKEQNALKSVMPDAERFEEYRLDDCITPGLIDGIVDDIEKTKVFEAFDSGIKPIGMCVITETTGYDVGIKTVTGVDDDLRVTGVEILSMNETPGLGAKAAEEGFRSQYIGKGGTIGVSKSAPSDTDIQAISGATKTSNGVTHGVNIALQIAEILLGGGNK